MFLFSKQKSVEVLNPILQIKLIFELTTIPQFLGHYLSLQLLPCDTDDVDDGGDDADDVDSDDVDSDDADAPAYAIEHYSTAIKQYIHEL